MHYEDFYGGHTCKKVTLKLDQENYYYNSAQLKNGNYEHCEWNSPAEVKELEIDNKVT